MTPADEARRRVAEIVEAFPGGRAVPTAGVHLSLEARGKRFGWFMENHHGDGRLELECRGPLGVAQALATANPAAYYVSKFAFRGQSVGAWLDVPDVDWAEIADLLHAAYASVRPKRG